MCLEAFSGQFPLRWPPGCHQTTTNKNPAKPHPLKEALTVGHPTVFTTISYHLGKPMTAINPWNVISTSRHSTSEPLILPICSVLCPTPFTETRWPHSSNHGMTGRVSTHLLCCKMSHWRSNAVHFLHFMYRTFFLLIRCPTSSATPDTVDVAGPLGS